MSPTLSDETRRRLALNLYLSRPRRNRRRRHYGLLLPLILAWTGTAIAAIGSFALITWFLTVTH